MDDPGGTVLTEVTAVANACCCIRRTAATASFARRAPGTTDASTTIVSKAFMRVAPVSAGPVVGKSTADEVEVPLAKEVDDIFADLEPDSGADDGGSTDVPGGSRDDREFYAFADSSDDAPDLVDGDTDNEPPAPLKLHCVKRAPKGSEGRGQVTPALAYTPS